MSNCDDIARIEVGDCVVIGTGAVVTKNVEVYETVAGVLAKKNCLKNKKIS